MAEPQWFFDDALSRVRWKWAASMRESEPAEDGGQCESLGRHERPGSADRVGRDEQHAAWTPVAGGHSTV